MLVATNLGMTVPSAPGYVGVYHYIAVQSLRVFGVDESSGLAVAFVLHAVGFGVFTLAGAVLFVSGLVRQRWTVSDLWRLTSSEPAAGPGGAGKAGEPAGAPGPADAPPAAPAAPRPRPAPVRGEGVGG